MRPRYMVCVLILVVASVPAWPLSEQQIEEAIQKGLSAQDVKEAPAFLRAGVKSPKGSTGRTIMFGVSEALYSFHVRGCKQWVSNLAFRSKIDNTDLDRESIRSQCLGKETIRILVAIDTQINELVAPSFGHRPIGSKPVTAIVLEFDEKMLKPLQLEKSGEFGAGNASALFNAKWFKDAKEVSIVATINSEYQLSVRIPKKVLRELF